MIMEVTGDPILKLKGRRREIVAAGPSPGRMPTIVPRRAPINANVRFVRLNAIPNPFMSPWNIPKISFIPVALLPFQKPRWQGDIKKQCKDEVKCGSGPNGNA